MYLYDGQAYEHAQLTAPVSITRKPRAKKRTPKRIVNYAGKNRASTDELHSRMFEALALFPAISVRDLADLVGISRQLCLYHVKKMCAQDRIVAELAPCHGNGGVMFVLYTKLQRAVELGAWLLRQQGRIAA